MKPEIFAVMTLDTEPDCDTSWYRSSPLTFTSVTHGIPKILRPLWDTYRIQPVYFVSPEVTENDEAVQILRQEKEKGAEIAAHLHSEYIEPQKKYTDYAATASKEYPCFAYDAATEAQKIANLTKLIERRIGVRPTSYRAARYGADLDTIKALQTLNYSVDSSITPGISWRHQKGPDHSRAPQQPYYIAPDNYYTPSPEKSGLLEVPITVAGKRLGAFGKFLPDTWLFYRWLRPSHMTAWEQKRLIHEMIQKSEASHATTPLVLNFMFHSMEIIPQATPFVRSAFEQKLFISRLAKTIGYAQSQGARFITLIQLYEYSQYQ